MPITSNKTKEPRHDVSAGKNGDQSNRRAATLEARPETDGK